MGQVNQPTNLIDRVRDLEKTVRQLRSMIGLSSATITRGGLTLRDDAFLRMVDDQNVEILYVGPDNEGRQVIRLRREGGGDVLYTYFAGPGLQYWTLTDTAGHQLVADDALSGQGLARPYLTWSLVPTAELAAIPANQATTSGTFVPVWTAFSQKQHPRVRLVTLTRTDVGTTGEIRLRDPGTGSVIMAPISLPSGDNSLRLLDAPIAGNHLDIKSVDVEIRRVSGGGSVAARAQLALGLQS